MINGMLAFFNADAIVSTIECIDLARISPTSGLARFDRPGAGMGEG